jgi:hypothetical protein
MRRTISTEHKLLTDEWTADVEMVEAAIRRMDDERTVTNDCRVVLFEIDRDASLHVNVTHGNRTKAVSGWTGPAIVKDGFVSNRTFSSMRPDRIVSHIREMVFADRA